MGQDMYSFCELITYLHWKHIEKEDAQKEVIWHAEKNLFFCGQQRSEPGIIDLLLEIFKSRCKMWWLQSDINVVE